jgi:hypothetical protein
VSAGGLEKQKYKQWLKMMSWDAPKKTQIETKTQNKTRADCS